MKITSGKYELSIIEADGKYGVAVNGSCGKLYQDQAPVILILKDYAAKHVEMRQGYDSVEENEGIIIAKACVKTSAGSVFAFTDTYEACEQENTFRFHRNVLVEEADKDDLGFGSRVSLHTVQGGTVGDYEYLAPGGWYRNNEYAPDHFIGKDLDLPSYWFRETRFALPMFAMRSKATGETAVFCREKADIRLPEGYEQHYDCRTDGTFNFGSLGISVPEGIAIDYVFPGTEGLNEDMTPYRDQPYRYQFGLNKRYNPVEKGYEQDYGLFWRFAPSNNFREMMREQWRFFYNIFNPQIVDLDNDKLYHVCMDTFDELCREYYGSWGVPFKCLLPGGEIGIVDYQMGFIGQQPNIGYQLIRYGEAENRPETTQKGINVIDWWVHNSLTDWGAPKTWFDPEPAHWLNDTIWLRMIGDGMEGILDSYVYFKKQGREYPDWIAYCKTVGDWLANSQDAEGCWGRAYHEDGRVKLESKANTSNVIRFLVQLYLVTKDERYKETALRAGAWCYENVYLDLRYVGGTCDNADVLDKESGIYAIMSFMALYDLTGDEKWMEALIGAADYTETWTYAWSYPVRPIEKIHAFHKGNISGQSLIATGHSAADVYMAACSYLYYRLYLMTEDKHYLHFAEFISKNPKQGTDLDGETGYGRKGIGEESNLFYNFDCRGVYAWLPWVTYVQIDPIQRMMDTFGCYEIADAEKLPMEERQRRNRIYDTYAGE